MQSVEDSVVNETLAQRTQRSLLTQYKQAFEPILGCGSKEAFLGLLEQMKELISKMNKNDQFNSPNDELTSRKLINKIDKVASVECLNISWVSVQKLLKLMEPFKFDRFVRDVDGFNGKDVQLVENLLQLWLQVYELNLLNYNEKNRDNDSESRVMKEEIVIQLLRSVSENVTVMLSEQGVISNGNS